MADIEVKVDSHLSECMAALETAIQRGLEAAGLLAEGYAKKLCPVDTGLLRNSITHAVSGVPISHAYHASYGSEKYKAKDGTMKRRNANSKGAGSVGYGVVSGIVGSEKDHVCYIGTNVEYAAYVELGTKKTKAQPFIRPAVENHAAQYKRVFEKCLKGTD